MGAQSLVGLGPFLTLTMNSYLVTLFSLVCLATISQAYKVPEPRECSFEIAAACVTEIGAAWDACGDFPGQEAIMGCMEGIIGATDCWDCVCTVLSFPGASLRRILNQLQKKEIGLQFKTKFVKRAV